MYYLKLGVLVLIFMNSMFSGLHQVDENIKHNHAANPSDSSGLENLEVTLEEMRKTLKIPGMSAAIVRDQEIYWSKGFGFADLENEIEATPDTPYQLASVTKPIAATLLMQLIADGYLSLDDPVSEYGVDLESRGEILVRHLLTHTSHGQPGMEHNYDGSRYALLGAVIETATGESLWKLLNDMIIVPSGMENAAPNPTPNWENSRKAGLFAFQSFLGLGNENVNTPNVYDQLANPYQFDAEYNIIDGKYNLSLSPAAGLISSAKDIAKFDIALDRNILLSESLKNTMHSPAISTYVDDPKLQYGLGWYVQEYNDMRLLWHAGRWPPSTSALYIKIPDKNTSFIILANTDYLTAPFDCLGNGDVLCSSFALAFLKHIEFGDTSGTNGLGIDWKADKDDLISELRTISEPESLEFLERELWSNRQMYSSLGDKEAVANLDRVQQVVFGYSELQRVPYIRSTFSVIPNPETEGLSFRDLMTLYRSGLIWLILCLVSTFIFAVSILKQPGKYTGYKLGWALVVLVYGPIGLGLYFGTRRNLRGRKEKHSITSRLLNAAVDAVLRAAIYVLWIVVLIQFFIFQEVDLGPIVIISLFYIIPVIAGFFVYGGFPGSRMTNSGYWVAVRQGVVKELISFSLLLLGVFPVIFIIFENWFPGKTLLFNPLSWVLVSLGGLSGGLVLFPYCLWLSHKRKESRSESISGSVHEKGGFGDPLVRQEV